MTLRLAGSTSGYTEIDAPAVAGSNTLVLPTGNGSADQALVTNGSGTLSFADRGRMVLETAKTATSTAVDFTSIPSWVKRVTVMFDGVSTNGTSAPQIQIGDSGGIETTGYICSNSVIVASVGTANFTTGFGIGVSTGQWGATRVVGGSIALTLLNLATNTWSASGSVGSSDMTAMYVTAGAKSLSATLDRVRITTVNGTDTFDAGSINILYEG
jgi:hypothetical protein